MFDVIDESTPWWRVIYRSLSGLVIPLIVPAPSAERAKAEVEATCVGWKVLVVQEYTGERVDDAELLELEDVRDADNDNSEGR